MKYIFVVLLLALSYYSFLFEPNNLEVKELSIYSNKINSVIKIAHISDLHTQGLGSIEKKLINDLNKTKPDIIFITGDIATPKGTYQGYKEVLNKIKAPKGVYFTKGNWEYWSPISEIEKLLEQASIIDLTNESIKVNELQISGFDDILEGNPNQELLKNSKHYSIALFHSPIFFQETKKFFDLSLAGHSHGGQVRIPFFGPIWTPQGTGKFDQGLFEEDNSKLYVNRGIGTSVLPMRFNCKPELTIINLIPKL